MAAYMMNKIISILSKHPFDWIVHFILCFVPVYFGWAIWFVVLFVCVLIEYEQKTQVWYNHFSWREYIIKCSLGDMIADILGIIIGMYLK
jgi:hypothetical protein